MGIPIDTISLIRMPDDRYLIADGGTWLLEPSVLMKSIYDNENREALIFNFISIGSY